MVPWYNGTSPQIKDLGLPPALVLDPTSVSSYVSVLDSHFSLVLINEHYDESIVLLAQELCLPLWDVTYFNQKHRSTSARVFMSETKKGLAYVPRYFCKTPLSADDRERVQRHFSADYQLYEHFQSVHEASVARFGRARMDRFVAQLHELQEYATERCGIATNEKAETGTLYC